MTRTELTLTQALANIGFTANEAIEAIADYTADDALVDALKAECTVTYEEFEQMGAEERKALWKKINAVLDNNGWVGNVNIWDVVYDTYRNMTAVEDNEYYARNIDAFNEFVRDNIEGRTYDEIDADTWGFYSDWHKDMFGFRPR